ncbi:MAG: hypothetical protein ACKVT0_01635 [Planctomycetaceae bacterium]
MDMRQISRVEALDVDGMKLFNMSKSLSGEVGFNNGFRRQSALIRGRSYLTRFAAIHHPCGVGLLTHQMREAVHNPYGRPQELRRE